VNEVAGSVQKSGVTIGEISSDLAHPLAIWSRKDPGDLVFPDRVESIFEKDPFDCVSRDLMSEIMERSSDSGVAPPRIVVGHQEDQLLDIGCGPWTTWTSILAADIFFRDQLPVPPEQSIRGHQGLYLEEPSSAIPLGLHREPAAL